LGVPCLTFALTLSLLYSCILANPDQKFANDKVGCAAICNEMKLDMNNVATGVTMMLYRAEEHKNLELQYSVKVEKIRMNQTLTELIAKKPDQMPEAQREQYFEQLSRAVNMANEFNLQTDVANRARKLLVHYSASVSALASCYYLSKSSLHPIIMVV
jgi:hypothetical protein